MPTKSTEHSVSLRGERGFTLIEVMIAILVLAIGILGIAKMQISAIKGNSFGSGLTEATSFSQNKMEELASLAYTDLNDVDGDGTSGLDDTVNPDGSQTVSGATGIQYEISWNIAVDDPAPNAKYIRVIVQWQQEGTTRKVIFDRIKANI